MRSLVWSMLSLGVLTMALPRNVPRSRKSSPGLGFGKGKATGPVLPAGTVVKHGTTSDVLKQILREGVRPSGSVSAGWVRDSFEVRPTRDAVYVPSSYAAYAAAVISFTSKMAAQVRSGFSLDPDLVPLPVVLNIRLQEDCVLGPDEDYLWLDEELGKRYTESKNSDAVKELWLKFGSGAILRDNGLPAEWIESVECPHVPTALCLERAFALNMVATSGFFKMIGHGRWDDMPLLYTTAASSREIREALGCSSADLLNDRETLKLMVDDVFKLIHAYALTQTNDKAAKMHASIEKFDDGAAVAYVTPLLSSFLPLGKSPKVDDLGKPRSRSIGIMLSGKPSDWDVLNPDDPRLEWFEEQSRTEKMAGLKAAYSRLLWDCCQFFLIALKLQPRRLPW